jgi:hypothetical protein
MSTKCPTYSYWHDLITDLRKPKSWLDLANMILRRFRLVLVREIENSDKSVMRLRKWLDFLDEIHEQGKCNVCSVAQKGRIYEDTNVAIGGGT